MRTIKTWQAALLVAMGLMCVGAGIYFSAKNHSQPENSIAANNPVSTLLTQKMTTPSGQQSTLSKWKGRPMLVNFWAPWCAPCVEEMPALTAMQKNAGAENFQIIGIGIDSAANIGAFIDRHAITYPIFVSDPSGINLMRSLGNQPGGLPYSILIDSQGTVHQTYLGKLDMARLKKDVAALGVKS